MAALAPGISRVSTRLPSGALSFTFFLISLNEFVFWQIPKTFAKAKHKKENLFLYDVVHSRRVVFYGL